MIRIVTCTECPNGCQVSVELEDNKIISVSNYICPKGKIYAENEIVAPRRVLTTTVKTANGRVLPVKTDAPILKVNMFSVMEKVNSLTVSAPVKIGQVLYENIDENINLIATMNLE